MSFNTHEMGTSHCNVVSKEPITIGDKQSYDILTNITYTHDIRERKIDIYLINFPTEAEKYLF